MAIIRDFKETVQARALQDPAFREGLLRESIDNMLAGDTETGKALLRDYINATIGFEELGNLIHKSPKSLMRMCSSSGNPTANNLFDIIHTLQQREGLHLQVQAVRC
jgi:DNA-binding phage protein